MVAMENLKCGCRSILEDVPRAGVAELINRRGVSPGFRVGNRR